MHAKCTIGSLNSLFCASHCKAGLRQPDNQIISHTKHASEGTRKPEAIHTCKRPLLSTALSTKLTYSHSTVQLAVASSLFFTEQGEKILPEVVRPMSLSLYISTCVQLSCISLRTLYDILRVFSCFEILYCL